MFLHQQRTSPTNHLSPQNPIRTTMTKSEKPFNYQEAIAGCVSAKTELERQQYGFQLLKYIQELRSKLSAVEHELNVEKLLQQ